MSQPQCNYYSFTTHLFLVNSLAHDDIQQKCCLDIPPHDELADKGGDNLVQHQLLTSKYRDLSGRKIR